MKLYPNEGFDERIGENSLREAGLHIEHQLLPLAWFESALIYYTNERDKFQKKVDDSAAPGKAINPRTQNALDTRISFVESLESDLGLLRKGLEKVQVLHAIRDRHLGIASSSTGPRIPGAGAPIQAGTDTSAGTSKENPDPFPIDNEPRSSSLSPVPGEVQAPSPASVSLHEKGGETPQDEPQVGAPKASPPDIPTPRGPASNPLDGIATPSSPPPGSKTTFGEPNLKAPDDEETPRRPASNPLGAIAPSSTPPGGDKTPNNPASKAPGGKETPSGPASNPLGNIPTSPNPPPPGGDKTPSEPVSTAPGEETPGGPASIDPHGLDQLHPSLNLSPDTLGFQPDDNKVPDFSTSVMDLDNPLFLDDALNSGGERVSGGENDDDEQGAGNVFWGGSEGFDELEEPEGVTPPPTGREGYMGRLEELTHASSESGVSEGGVSEGGVLEGGAEGLDDGVDDDGVAYMRQVGE